MNKQRRKAALVWVVIGVVALFFNYMYESRAEEQIKVVVAAKNIPSGVTIHADMITEINVPISKVQPGYFPSSHDVEGLKAAFDILQGDQLTSKRVNIDGGRMQQYSFTFPIKTIADGQVSPGDVVEVWLDYDDKLFPGKDSIRLKQNAVVTSILDERNNRIADMKKSGVAPRFVTINVNSPEEHTYLRDMSNKGYLFPVPPSKGGGELKQ